jgi:mRNA interferase MazF
VCIRGIKGTGKKAATVVPLTGNIHKRPEMPTHVQIPLSGCVGLKRPSMALAEQVDTVDKVKIKDKIGEIHDNLLMEQITVALQIQIGVFEEYN